MTGVLNAERVVFLARHGSGHTVPPHLVNYRANIWAVKKLGVKWVIATAAVGSLNQEFKPGHFVLVDQFIDFTKTRNSTFFDGGNRGVAHVDMTEPYCPVLRQHLHRIGLELGLNVHAAGTYVCTDGPRFETPAEIRMFKTLGGDVVGMTSVPEVVLAKEAELCYATICMVTNFAAGITDQKLTHQEVLETFRLNSRHIKQLIARAIAALPSASQCGCRFAMREYGGFKL